jgi:Fe-S oxidoreductase
MILILKMMPSVLAYTLHYGLFIAALALFGLQMYARMREVARGRNENRTDRIGARIKAFFTYVVFQKKLFRDFIPGIAHAFIFWGFVVLAFGYAIFFLTAREVHESFLVGLLGHNVVNIYLFLQDFFAALVLLGVLYGFYNHFIRRYKRLENSFDAALILSLIFFIILFFFLSAEVRTNIAGDRNPWTPFTNIFASVIGGSSHTFYMVVYWLHNLFILGFLVYLPSSKHLHLAVCEFNVFFLNLDAPGKMRFMDLEKEETFGANRSEDLTWRSLFDAYSCVECGRCTAACPANITDKPLNPKKIVNQLREYLDDRRRKPEDQKPQGIIKEYTSEDEIWSCTTCLSCQQECPILIEHLDKIYAYRRHLVLTESSMPQELNQLFKNLETRFNPWPIAKDARADWVEGLPVQKFSEEKKSADYLFFVGCAASFDERNKKVAASFVKLLKKAGVDFAILGVKEKCCGEPARRIGNEYLYQMMAMENVQTFSEYKFKKIVTMCPHCFNTIKNEYPQLGGEYEVIHHTELLQQLIKEGKLKPSKETAMKVTLHDSCYLGRYNSVYEQPRSILAAVPGVDLKEMKKSKSYSFCCGGGGGRMWMEEKLGTRINQERIKQAASLEPDVLVSACPYCLTMFTDGIQEISLDDKMRALDISEILEGSIPE